MTRACQFCLAVVAAVCVWAACVPALPTVRADAPGHVAYTQDIPGTGVKFEMVAIPAGTFMLGSPAAETGHQPNEGPQASVKLGAFWLGKHEVTWDEYEWFQKEMGVEDRDENKERRKKTADAVTGPTPPYVSKYYGHGQAGFPAICMTHHAAWEYCRWLSKKTGRAYRLPTEAEWEYAARAGTKTAYFFGDDPAKLGDYAWYAANSADDKHLKGTTHKVGTRKANPWGLHDILGNVIEWTLDVADKDAYARYAKLDPAIDPLSVKPERKWGHITRGGSWADAAPALRSAARRPSDRSWMKHDPQEPQSIWWLTKFDVVGLRLCRAVKEPAALKELRSLVVEDTDE